MAKSSQIGAGAAVPLSPGKASLITRLYREHAEALRHYILSRFGPGPPEPEEVTQAAFAKLASSPRFETLENPRGFLFAIACNIVVDHHRRDSYRNAVHRDMALTATDDSQSDFSPEDVLIAKERLAVFERTLLKMPLLRRQIFLMVRMQGMKCAEVAQHFGLKEDTVQKQARRALKECALALEAADRRGGGRK